MSEPLYFEELQVRRSPGFEREGFTLRGLSRGINLIHGPNGAGKSTTARAVAGLLWPGRAGGEGASLWGRFQLGEDEWGVDVDGTRVQYRRAGQQASAPVLPSGEGHQRYHLSLHDLLRERDTGFAAAVAREMAGGYDLRGSGAVLEPRLAVSRRGALNEKLDRAQQDYDAAVAGQEALLERERALGELRSAYATADAAQRRLTLLQAALDHARAREREAEARAALGRYAEAMERVSGTEYDQLCRLRESVQKLEAERRAAEGEAAEASARAASLALPEEALRDDLLPGLDADLTALRAAEQEVERAGTARARAIAKRDLEAQRLGDTVDLEHLATADLNGIAALAGLVRRADGVAARRDAAEAKLRLLPDSDAAPDSANLERGIDLLRCWLREPPPTAAAPSSPEGVRRMAGVAAAVLLLLLAGLLAGGGEPVHAAAAALSLVLLVVLLWPARAPAEAADAREVHRREFEKLGLEAPDVWEPGAVGKLLATLESRSTVARLIEAQQHSRRELEGELARIADEERGIETERARIAGLLGIIPPPPPMELAWVGETVGRWQSAHAEAAAEEAAVAAARLRVADLAAVLRRRLAPLGYPELSSAGEFGGAIEALRERRRALAGARDAARNAELRLTRIAADRARQEEAIGHLFQGLGLDPDSDETVRLWCDARAGYRRAYETHRHAVGVCQTTGEKLTALGDEAALASLPPQELERQIEAEAERAGRRDALHREIASTETLIESAKRAHDVEAALERLDRATQELRDARERDIRSAIALELIETFERATRDQHVPVVFRRARELFSRITHGRYELRLDQQGEPEFTAFDAVDRQERRLEELSSGTRVQLLLAVRVAFVEQQEQGVMLPLLLDEVLGNSDDERARAIMQAALALAREGRQVFYFTAQADEVARWRALAAEEGDGVELREIDLREVRALERRLEMPRLFPAARRTIPAPAGDDHAEYGRQLGVPRLDRAEAHASGVHLWYLVDDPQSLHGLLRLGAERWGALAALVRNGGRLLVDEGLLQELEVCGRATEAFLEAARIGVGRRVDRAVLEGSGAVTATFLDRVDDLAQRLGGDGARLMEALEAKEVPRFSQQSKDGLREYLAAEGYLPQEAPLEVEEIRGRVLARMAAEVAAGAVTLERLDRLVGRLWAGVGGGVGDSAEHPAG